MKKEKVYRKHEETIIARFVNLAKTDDPEVAEEKCHEAIIKCEEKLNRLGNPRAHFCLLKETELKRCCATCEHHSMIEPFCEPGDRCAEVTDILSVCRKYKDFRIDLLSRYNKSIISSYNLTSLTDMARFVYIVRNLHLLLEKSEM